MRLKDLEIFCKSISHSAGGKAEYSPCWWDTTSSDRLQQIVDNLSNPDTPERKKIRQILTDNNIRSVLDSGCGPGTELRSYQNVGMDLKYVGIDISEKMLKIARERNPDYLFVEGDVNRMPFADYSFEAVVLKHILEHLPYYQQALKEATRISSRIVVVNFFHMLWFFDYLAKHKDGFWENWYSRRKFEKFINTLPISRYEKFRTVGNSRQTAEIYVLFKDKGDR